ncbi:hypothetical protein H4V95_001407 [Arthrobacter sp. CAN_C5]|nr:hypothetical protein [Arthrobacter sp. CAN_C5]
MQIGIFSVGDVTLDPTTGTAPAELERIKAMVTTGSPQEVIEKTLTFREFFVDYQRQLFLVDHAGLPLKTVLEQLDLLGSEVLPVLRQEFAQRTPGNIPAPPTFQNRLQSLSEAHSA